MPHKTCWKGCCSIACYCGMCFLVLFKVFYARLLEDLLGYGCCERYHGKQKENRMQKKKSANKKGNAKRFRVSKR